MPVTPDSVPERVSVRLDEEQRARLATWMNTVEVEQVSTAIRTLLDLGLSRAEALAPEVARRMAREGFTHGYSALLERLAVLFEEMRQETRPR